MPRFTGDTIKLTNAIVKTLALPEGKKDKLWFDTEQRGFFVRKFASGKTTYGVKYTCKGQQRRIKLGPVLPGNLDKMRALASEIVGQARVGVDMAANAKAEAKAKRKATLGDLLPTYLDIREKGSPDKLWKKLRPNSWTYPDLVERSVLRSSHVTGTLLVPSSSFVRAPRTQG